MEKTPSPSYSPELSPLSSLDHLSPPPSDLIHVSQSHPSKTIPINTHTKKSNSPFSSSPDLSPLSSPPSDLRHVSQSHPSKNNNNNNINNIINNPSRKPHFNTPSTGSSPSSDLCHVSPSPPPRNTGLPARSSDSSPPSDLCHVSPSPRRPPREGRRREKAEVRGEEEVRKAALGVRVFGAAFCLVSLAVMAADKEKGWAVDSFFRYKEFRYCISVNVVGFLYSVAQTCDLVFTICTGKYVLRHQYRFYFDFALDQILTYLLMSASSSAATRVDDWESNWGKDQFPTMASISVGLSFMSFVSFAASSLISGYAFCAWSST